MPAPAVVPRPPHKDTDAMSLGPLAGVVGFHIAQAAVTTADTFERHTGARFKLRTVEYSLLRLS